MIKLDIKKQKIRGSADKEDEGVQWEAICDCFPSEDEENEEELRRELWSVFTVTDSAGLTLSELAGGVAAVTQSQEMFDCLPAVATAFKFTKLTAKDGLEEEQTEPTENTADKDKEEVEASARKAENTLYFDEFRMFLLNLRQYFLFCQLFHNNDVNPKKSIKKKRFLKNDKIERMKQLVGENGWEEEFDKLDQDKDEKITFEDLIRNLSIP